MSAQPNFTISASNSLLTSHVEEVVINAYQHLGIKAAIKQFPAARALVLANNGITDGELMRVKSIVKYYPNLAIVPVPLYTVRLNAYRLGKAPNIKDLQSLGAYKIGIIRGAKNVARSTENMQRIIADNHLHLFDLLKKQRIEVAIASAKSAQAAIAHLELQSLEIKFAPLKQFPVFHFVHKKHQKMIPALTQAITDQLKKSSLSEVVNSH